MLISNKLHSFRNFSMQRYKTDGYIAINSHFLSYSIAVILRTVLTLFSSFSNNYYGIQSNREARKKLFAANNHSAETDNQPY